MSWIDCGLAREVRRAVQLYNCDGGNLKACIILGCSLQLSSVTDVNAQCYRTGSWHPAGLLYVVRDSKQCQLVAVNVYGIRVYRHQVPRYVITLGAELQGCAFARPVS